MAALIALPSLNVVPDAQGCDSLRRFCMNLMVSGAPNVSAISATNFAMAV
jgi:hypothetical protein